MVHKIQCLSTQRHGFSYLCLDLVCELIIKGERYFICSINVTPKVLKTSNKPILIWENIIIIDIQRSNIIVVVHVVQWM